MDTLTAKEREQALEVILAEGREGLSREEACRQLRAFVRLGRSLHKLYEADCNRPLDLWERQLIQTNERDLEERFASLGLGLYLNGDPRGNPVGILTPQTGRYNTMGGRECGWRL